MKITEIKSILPYLNFSIPIGIGTTAICFLMKNGKVLKLFIETSNKQHLFYFYDMKLHLDYISTISNDTYIGPDELLIKNDKVIGYIYPYVKGNTLIRLNNDTKLDTIIKPYEKLLKDTKKISDNGFYLQDLSQRNMILNEEYKVIDLDRGFKDGRSDLYDSNRRKINRIILNAIFDLGYFDYISFFDDNLENLRYDADYTNQECFYELLEKLFKNNLTKKEVKKNIYTNIITKNPNYYRHL